MSAKDRRRVGGGSTPSEKSTNPQTTSVFTMRHRHSAGLLTDGRLRTSVRLTGVAIRETYHAIKFSELEMHTYESTGLPVGIYRKWGQITRKEFSS